MTTQIQPQMARERHLTVSGNEIFSFERNKVFLLVPVNDLWAAFANFTAFQGTLQLTFTLLTVRCHLAYYYVYTY